MVDPLYRALVLAAIGLAGCENSHEVGNAGPGEEDMSQGDVSDDEETHDEETHDEEEAPCPADAELNMPPCYLIL